MTTTALRRAAVRAWPLGLATSLSAALAWLPIRDLAPLLAAALSVAALLAMTRAPALALAAAVALVPFGPRMALPLGGAALTPPTPLIALAIGGVALGHLATRRRPKPAPGVVFIAGMTAAWLTVLAASALHAPSPTTAALEIVRWGVFGAAVAVAGTLRGARGRRWGVVVVLAILASGAAEAAYGSRLALAGIGPDAFGLAGGRSRAFGNFGQPNPFGGYMNLIWPLGVALIAERLWPRRDARGGRLPLAPGHHLALPIAALAAAACLAGLGLSWSRGAWLAAVAGGGAMAVLRCAAGLRRPRDAFAVVLPYIAVTTLVAAFTFGVAPGIPASVANRVATITGAAGAGAASNGADRLDLARADVTGANFSTIERLAHWDAATRMWADRPWLGQGPGHFALRYQAYRLPRWPYDLGHAHNAYLNTLAETGLLGLLANVALMAAALALAVRAAVAPHNALEGALGLAAAGSLTAVAVHSLFDLLWVHDMTVLLGVLIGLTLAARTWEPGGETR
ncbi:MAG: O-antigen ligase family protein [Ardenticatenales bacterium]|nr:O-antigen ligase family protein [Ardenticatenales bacterium]